MSQTTGISWTNATWNPVTGCSRVSPGCEHCYAESLSLRRGWSVKPWTAQNAAENVKLHPDRLDQPLRWRSPRRVFVNSMSDLFHPLIPDDFIDRVFATMGHATHHVFQVLTKRPERMRDYFNRPEWLGKGPYANVWLGFSAEDQRRYDERWHIVAHIPAAVRWASLEPLLGPIDVANAGLDWIVVGGESGPGFRPMSMEWLTEIDAATALCGIPLFVKQDSGSRPGKQGRIPDSVWVRKEFPA